MKITLQYFDGCPNWKTTDTHLQKLVETGLVKAEVDYQLIDTIDAAEQHQFHGSPTVLIDGIDPFANDDTPVGLACRVYQTEQGPAGSPTIHQLEQAITGTQVRG